MSKPQAASQDFSPRIASREDWLAERKWLLQQERELTHLRDKINARRRQLPWVKVEQNYVFDGADGEVTLADLFEHRSQLIVYHFMLTPGSDHLCGGCSFLSDHIDAARQHFEHADLSFAAISRAPYTQIAPVQRRMGWRFTWVSSFRNSFNYDYGVSFTDEQVAKRKTNYNFGTTDDAYADLPGTSVFAKDASGAVFHTYSSYARAGETLIGAFNWLDLVPKGRNENGTMSWVRLHDEYDKPASGCCH
jgi:predicted dithiol-disulfide oxidoreductase (DUF899 family)